MENNNSKKIDGYYDKERNVFVITKDEDGTLASPAKSDKTEEEQEVDREKILAMFKKYKPDWIR